MTKDKKVEPVVKDQKDYFSEYEKKRKAEQSRLPTCYISNDLRTELDKLIEDKDLKMKDLMLSGVMIVQALLESKVPVDSLIVTQTFKRSRADIEKDQKEKIAAVLKKKLK